MLEAGRKMCVGEREEVGADSVLIVVPETFGSEGARDEETGVRIGGVWWLMRVEGTFIVSGETDLVGRRGAESFAS